MSGHGRAERSHVSGVGGILECDPPVVVLRRSRLGSDQFRNVVQDEVQCCSNHIRHRSRRIGQKMSRPYSHRSGRWKEWRVQHCDTR